MKLENKVALITGAGSGIGKATAILFAAEGSDVAVNDINLANAQITADLITRTGRKAIAVKADVAQEPEVVAMVDRVIRELGGIDILINNAGVGGGGAVLGSKTADWDRIQAVILRGTYLCSREAGRWMTEHRSGKIINISSIGALRARSNMSAYASAKAGIITLTRSLALEWAPFSLNVNCIIPGGIDTPMTQAHALTSEVIKQLIPLGHLGQPEDIARAALFLVSEDANFITGAALPVDGGELTRY